ncbi:Cilia- and flagella-associated protein 58 [Labeo rohita]|uniref:Cilia- and flagella-associated protein 58 n=1 Tax=Labeo rohita TaxID=84645 RepID=A0ABQ8MZI4_LABRO|nr:Cilia- and flagella-associated protein 58 [Labeo rohita]
MSTSVFSNKLGSETERQEVFHMQRELLKERTRCRALEDELSNPLNVHRWRRLEASDPSSFELIQKIHSLQRRLIAKTQEIVEKELLLQTRNKCDFSDAAGARVELLEGATFVYVNALGISD